MKRIVCLSVLMMLVIIGSAHALDITRIEINQALGYQKNNNMNFVAGKDTVIRAFLSEAVVANAAQTWAKVGKDGAPVVQLEPKSNDAAANVVDFLCPTRAACGNWAAGTYTFEVSVNGISKKEPADGSTKAYVFKERKKIRVLAVPVKANYNGTVMQVSDEKWKTSWNFMSSVFPVAYNGITWTIGQEFDASDSKYSQQTATGVNNEGRGNLLDGLENLMPSHCKANPSAEGCYDMIVGFIPQGINANAEGTLQIMGYTRGLPVTIVAAKQDNIQSIVAHEAAHPYGVGDTYEDGSLRCVVNPAPDGMQGKDWDDPGKKVSCTAGRILYPGGLGSTLIPASQDPYEVGGRGALGDMADYMGSSGSDPKIYWTTQDAYDQLFNQLAIVEATRSLRANTTQRMIDFSGTIGSNGNVVLHPWNSFTDTAEVSCDSTGDYTLAALDQNGQIVASQALNVKFWVMTNPPEKIDPAQFNGAMCFPTGTVKFQIRKGSAVLKEVPVSENAPVITLTDAPTNPQGKYTIKWTASDKDADKMGSGSNKLTYIVEYNNDVSSPDSEWMILAADIEQTQWEEDFSQLPGSSHAKIRVTVSDGILTGTAESAEFSVPVKGPEVFVETPEWGVSYQEDEDILLQAEAYDPQDEWLSDDKLEWSSNLGNKRGSLVIGKGGELIVDDLKPGIHTITVKATNSAGKSTVGKAITLSVGNEIQAPVLKITVSGTTATASWNAIANAKYKFLYKSDPDADYTSIDVGNLTSLSGTLPQGMILYVTVQAYTDAALSNLSNMGYIGIPVSSLNIGNVGADLKIRIPCVQFQGNQYKFDLNHSPFDSLRWNMDTSSFKTLQNNPTACLSIGSDFKLNLSAGVAGVTYSFVLNYDPTYQAAPFSWKMDASSVKKQ